MSYSKNLVDSTAFNEMTINKIFPAPEHQQVHSQKLLDLRETTNHPLSLRYSEVFSQCILWGRFEHGRTQPGFDILRSAPFVKAAKAAIAYGPEREGALNVIIDVLEVYYSLVCPANAAAWLGLDGPNAPFALTTTPPWGAVPPWRARSIDSYQKAHEDAALKENEKAGRIAGIEEGWFLCGPANEDKIKIEAERILFVLLRMLEYGYQRSDDSDGDVRSTALVDEAGNWRWIITSGNHRAAVAAALGLPRIPIRVNLVISRSDVRYWRHVADGLVTVEQALEVFDAYFNAKPPALVQAWKELTDTHSEREDHENR